MKVNIQASLGAGLDNGNSTSESLAFLHSQNSCSISHVIGFVGSGKCRILKGHTDPRHPNTEHEMVSGPQHHTENTNPQEVSLDV